MTWIFVDKYKFRGLFFLVIMDTENCCLRFGRKLAFMFDMELYVHKIEQLNRERILKDRQLTLGRDSKRKPHQQDMPESPCLISEKENFYPGSDVVVHAHRTPPGEPQRKAITTISVKQFRRHFQQDRHPQDGQ